MSYAKEDYFDLKKDKLDRILTIPNLIGILRMAWSVEFANRTVTEGIMPSSAEEAGLIGLTDALDGYIARNFDQKSNLGKIIDPLSDRVYAFSLLYTLLKTGQIPLEPKSVIPISAIAIRDLSLNIGALVYMIKNNAPAVKESNIFGKAKTALLTTSILSAFAFGYGNEGKELIAPISLCAAAATILPETVHILKELGKNKAKKENNEIDPYSIAAYEEKWAQEDKAVVKQK